MVQFIRRKEADTTERLNKGKKNKEESPGEGKDRSLPRSYDLQTTRGWQPQLQLVLGK